MKILQDNKGQAIVEAALIIPILLFLLMGMFVVGYWMNAQQIVSAAAREGARAGALTGDRAQVAPAVMSTMQVLNTQGVTIEVPDPIPCPGNPLYVKVFYKIPFGFAFFQKTYEEGNPGSSYPFSQVAGQAAARVETNPRCG